MKKILQVVAISCLLTSGLSASVFGEKITPNSANGAAVWSDVCMRCHNLREPADLSKRAWKYSMQHMRVRAGLTEQETKDILAFIQESKTQEDAK